MIKNLFKYSFFLFFIPLFSPAYADTADADIKSQEYQVIASDGTELNFMRYAAQGDHLIVWIAPGYGIHERSIQVARQLAAKGIEIWQIDLAEALFLPHSTEQMRAFTGQYVADLIEAAHKETGKKILLSARSYGAIPLLRGVRITHKSCSPVDRVCMYPWFVKSSRTSNELNRHNECNSNATGNCVLQSTPPTL